MEDGKKKANMQVKADLQIELPSTVTQAKDSIILQVAIGYGVTGITIQFCWINKDCLTISDFLELLKHAMGEKFAAIQNITLPKFSWVLEKADIYYSQKRGLAVRLNMQDESKVSTASGLFWSGKSLTGQDAWVLQLHTCFPILLSGIPLLGKVVQEEDGIRSMDLVLKNQGQGLQYGLDIQWKLTGKEEKLALGDADGLRGSIPAQGQSSESAKANVPDSAKANVSDSAKAKSDSVHWIDIQKSIGPFRILQIGFEMKKDGNEYAAYLYFSVQMNFSVIQAELIGLFIKIPFSILQMKSFSDLKKLGFGFQGLGITYESGPLMISGFLARKEVGAKEKPREAYEGMIRVQFNQLQLMAFGAYTTTETGKTSLFAFLLVKYPLGGPPAFFVTGLAAAFGINRRLTVPDVKEIPRFPLIAMVSGNRKDYSITEASNMLGAYIQEADGEYFIAAGVEFTSFEIMKSFVLVTVVFGKKFTLYLLGISEIRFPMEGPVFVFVQLAIRAQIAPDDGIFSFEATLTSQSYLFSRDCKLRGGFAFYLWTKGSHKGDFVITMGGYHPRFQKPEHYPSVDRVGIQWNITSHLSVNGEAYFAVTSSAMMAGGKLELLYQCGNLRAWLKVQADLLISWAPFAYDIYLGVSIGVSYVLKVWFVRVKLKVELSASVHLYGPEFAGSVKVTWCIISFTISFGAKNAKPQRISYSEMKARFLEDPLQIVAVRGLLGKEEREKETILQVHPTDTMFQVESGIPMTEIYIGSQKVDTQSKGPDIGVWPMGENRKLETRNQAKLYRQEQQVWTPVDSFGQGKAVLERENVPAALWGRKEPNPYKAEFVQDAITRVQFSMGEEKEFHKIGPYDYETLTKNEENIFRGKPETIQPLEVEDDLDQTFIQVRAKDRYYRSWETFWEAHSRKREEECKIFNGLGIPMDQQELAEEEIYREPEAHFFVGPVMRTVA